MPELANFVKISLFNNYNPDYLPHAILDHDVRESEKRPVKKPRLN